MKQKIDDILVTEWIKAQAREQIINDYIIKAEMDKQNLKVEHAELELLDLYLTGQWDANNTIFKENNCNREAFNTAYENFIYSNLVFNDYSAKNPIKDDDAEVGQVVQAVKQCAPNPLYTRV